MVSFAIVKLLVKVRDCCTVDMQAVRSIKRLKLIVMMCYRFLKPTDVSRQAFIFNLLNFFYHSHYTVRDDAVALRMTRNVIVICDLCCYIVCIYLVLPHVCNACPVIICCSCSSFYFSTPPSKFTKQNSAEHCYMFGSEPDL